MQIMRRAVPATLLRGDGIGPEIMEASLNVLDALGCRFEWDEQDAGEGAFERTGDPLPRATMESIRKTRLALKGPLATPVGKGFRSVNVQLRKEFDLYANLRPAYTYVHGGRFDNIDIILVRENTEGFYVGVEHYIAVGDDPKAVAEATGFNTREGCRRIAEWTFDYALRQGRKKVTIVHKANILKMMTGLFLDTAMEVAEKYQGRIEVEDKIVDNCAMQLVLNPEQFDVILTTNLFGDILSDEIAGLVGGLGMAPGGNIGKDAAIFEAVHGSAPDIAGQGIANPAAVLLAAAMMLDHLEEQPRASLLRETIERVITEDGIRTRDLGGAATTHEFTEAIIRRLRAA